MNILLIHPKLNETKAPRFPLGLGYIASVLHGAGHAVRALDLNAEDVLEIRLKEKIKTGQFDVIGLSAIITQFNQIKRLSSLIRNTSKAIIVLGGGLASAVPELVLKETDVDITVVGEGEKTVIELAERLENRQPIEDINGIAYSYNGNIIKTPQRSYIEDISSIPFPAWDLFPMENYFKRAELGFPFIRMSVVTSRGCPYHCSFCFHGIFGHLYRSRSPENVVEEIAILLKKYGVRGINFEDDVFMLDRRRIYEICDLLVEKKIKVLWTCNGRVNLINRDLLDKMKTAGCVAISYGIESGSQKILNNISKRIKVAEAREAIKLTWEAGIIPHGFMMLGIPGETRQTIQDSINFCREAGISAEFTIATPVPGTRLYRQAMDRGKIISLEGLVKNWGHWFEDVLVNMTDISNSELISLKKHAEKEIFNNIKHKINYSIRMLFRELKINGPKAFIIRLFRGLRLIFRVRSGRGLSGV